MPKSLFVILVTGFTLAGCSTIEGLGEDIKQAGGSLSQTAREVKSPPPPPPPPRQKTKTIYYVD